MEPRRVEGAFDDALFDFIAGHDGLRPQVHSDARGMPTLGIGYAMLADTPGWPPCETLESDLAGIGVRLTARDRALLIAVGEALSRQDAAAARALVSFGAANRKAPAGFTVALSRAQAKALFDLGRPDVEMLLQHRLGRRPVERLAGSREMVALFSLAHHDPTLIGPDLVAALQEGIREEVWYLIRFASNPRQDPAVQRRRDREAAAFGLLGEPPAQDERTAVAELLDSRRLVMRRYLEEIGWEQDAIRGSLAQTYAKAGLKLPPCLRAAQEVQAARPRAARQRRKPGCAPALVD